MHPLLKLLIRCTLSLGASLFLLRFFFHSHSWYGIVILAALMVFMSYILEYTRNLEKEDG